MYTKKKTAEISYARNLDMLTKPFINKLRKNGYHITFHPVSMFVMISSRTYNAMQH
jgi:hypothetical protein